MLYISYNAQKYIVWLFLFDNKEFSSRRLILRMDLEISYTIEQESMEEMIKA